MLKTSFKHLQWASALFFLNAQLRCLGSLSEQGGQRSSRSSPADRTTEEKCQTKDRWPLFYKHTDRGVCSQPRQRHSQTGENINMSSISMFLCGDVMLARGIDQILEHSVDPILYEGNGMDAIGYVTLAEMQNGRLPPKSERSLGYIWGDALEILEEKRPDARIINLENAITRNPKPWPSKGIHYRMHPKNVNVIKNAKIDCCVLSNNHILDWCEPGLHETLSSLKGAGIPYSGAGVNLTEAQQPVSIDVPRLGRRVLVFAGGHQSSGVFSEWRARTKQAGVHLVEIHSSKSVKEMKELIKTYKKEGDVVVFSIHWGGNWGFDPDEQQMKWAHAMIDTGYVDLIHGHSSHHVKGVEVYKGKLIIYGCGDFLNDYEGITGHEHYRGDLALMYFPHVDPDTGNLRKLVMVPTQTKHLRVNRAQPADVEWLTKTMDRECRRLGTGVERINNELHLIVEGTS